MPGCVSVATLTPQERPGVFPCGAVARAKQAVRADRDEVGRKDVWQEPADACLGRDRADLDGPGLGVLILAGDLAICAREETMSADRHPKAVRSPIVPGVRSTADRCTMHHPVLCPESVGAKVKHGGLAPRIAPLGTPQEGKRLNRHQESCPGREPLSAIGSKPACGHQGVHRGMIVQGTRPGVQAPDPPDLAPDNAWIQGEVLEGLGGGAATDVGEELLVAAGQFPKRIGPGAGDQKRRDGPEEILLPREPRMGGTVLAVGTVAVLTGMGALRVAVDRPVPARPGAGKIHTG